jgi:drug/metabolite transporter (DMT)-like permease
MLPFSMSLEFWKSVFVNWQFAACGICYGAGSVLWFYIVKNYPFSMAYPLVSLSYVFGMIAAIIFFNETVDLMKWIGVLLIMLGCYFIAR